MLLPALPAALLLIDLQHAFLTPVDQTPATGTLVPRVQELARAWRAAGLPVVVTQEVHRLGGIDFGRELDGAEGVHCLEDDPLTALAFAPAPGDHLLVKRRYSCFVGTDLDILLRGLGVGTVVLAGALTDVCVHYTYADAHQRDLHARVVTDCVVGSSPAANDAALAAMTYLQRDARCTAADLMAHLPELVG
jgi:nicotinamidase-related amidase